MLANDAVETFAKKDALDVLDEKRCHYEFDLYYLGSS